MGEKHAQARDDKSKKVSKTNTGDGEKARTLYRQEGEKK
jgi:hypothetical protein